MWIQNNNNKPIWINITDKDLISKIIKKGSFKYKNKVWIYCSNDTNFDQVINIFFPDKNWEHYNKLKASIKHFKKTGKWLNLHP